MTRKTNMEIFVATAWHEIVPFVDKRRSWMREGAMMVSYRRFLLNALAEYYPDAKIYHTWSKGKNRVEIQRTPEEVTQTSTEYAILQNQIIDRMLAIRAAWLGLETLSQEDNE